jgi:hypothetical protein
MYMHVMPQLGSRWHGQQCLHTLLILPAMQQFTTVESSDGKIIMSGSVLCKIWSFLSAILTEWNQNT